MAETKGISGKIDAELHRLIKEEQERLGLTMSQYLEQVFTEHFTPKQEEVKSMEKTRTLAFQVNEGLFQRVKDYLRENNISQKDFVIGLIEDCLEQYEQEKSVKNQKEAEEEEPEEAVQQAREGGFYGGESTEQELDTGTTEEASVGGDSAEMTTGETEPAEEDSEGSDIYDEDETQDAEEDEDEYMGEENSYTDEGYEEECLDEEDGYSAGYDEDEDFTENADDPSYDQSY